MQLDFGTTGTSEVILSVSEYLDRLNIALGVEAGFVEGEITEFKPGAKWVGFTLKDTHEQAVLKCVMFIHDFKRLGVQIEDGMRVKVYGTPKISKGWGSLGMWVKTIEPLGEGSLKKAYELLVKKLREEGLFARKRDLPEFITRIGVISSREGVVLQDLRKNLANLGIKISFVHTNVEGVNAVPGLLRGLTYFARLASLGEAGKKPDVLIVIRGGGSLESMQAFNNEEVARALFAMPVPTIAGIGHDVDVPIAALIADSMASTPTGVAHIINETWSPLTETLPILTQKILDAQNIAMYRKKQTLTLLSQRIAGYFQNIFRSFDNLIARFDRNVDKLGEYLRFASTRVLAIENLLKLADPGRNLRLGYSITRDKSGKVIRSAKDAKMGETISTRLAEGEIESKISSK